MKEKFLHVRSISDTNRRNLIMFKKTSKILSTVIILTVIISLMTQPLCAAAADPGIDLQWNDATSMKLTLDLTQSKISISVTVTGRAGTTYKNGTALLEKLNGSTYEYVNEWKNISSSSTILQFNDSSVTRSKGTYRLTFTVTTVRNGSEETISANKVSTY